MRPRFIDLVAPSGTEVHEIWVQVESRAGVLEELTGVFAEAKADILSMHSQVAPDGLTDVLAYVEVGSSTITVNELVRRLKDKCRVRVARAEKKERTRYESFLFPVLVDEETRGLVLEESAWAAVVRRIEDNYGTGGSAILYEVGFALGEAFAAGIERKFGKTTESACLENFIAMFRAVGMGHLEVDEKNAGFGVRVKRPIAAATSARAGDRFVPGIVEGALFQVYSSKFTATNVRMQDGVLTFDVVSHALALPSVKQIEVRDGAADSF